MSAPWPVIREAELVERLAMSDDRFAALVASWAGTVAARPYDVPAFERAIGYPWSRPARSYVLSGESVEALEDLSAPAREALVDRFVSSDGEGERFPLLAFGSNGAPGVLTQKFAHFPDLQDRTVLVLTGYLHNFDVGAAAQPTFYGAMPATLFPSPQTRVRAAVLWLTSTQFTQLTWSELSYRLGRLRTRFDPDETGSRVDSVTAFVSRFGAFCPDGRPVALAAIPASGRTAEALSQEQLLDAAAKLALGPDARAEQLVRAIFEGMGAIAPRLAETIRPVGRPFTSDLWTPYPA